MIYIYSFCNADIRYVFSKWCELTRLGHDVLIITDQLSLKDKILNLRSSNFQPPLVSDIVVTTRPYILHYKPTSVYLFTLGTYLICNLVHDLISFSVPIFYEDCYFDISLYHVRLINPFIQLFSRYSSQICSKKRLIAQCLRQIFFDPFRQRFLFTGDGNVWLPPRYLSRLYPANVTFADFKTSSILPKRALLFVFSSTENCLPINWTFFQKLDLKLFYKPHPNPSCDYAHYPEFISPIYSGLDISSIEIPDSSYIVGFFSTSLSRSHSISLAKIYHLYIFPLTAAYLTKVSYCPQSFSELLQILR